MLARSQARIPIAGAIATFVFLSALAVAAAFVIRTITYADIDRELETLSEAIASELEQQGLVALEVHPLHRDVEANVLVFRLQRHSAVVVDHGRIVAVAGDIRLPTHVAAAALTRRADGNFTTIEPFSGQHWRARINVTHLGGRATGATLIVIRSMEQSRRMFDRIDVGLVVIVLLGVAGSAAILSIAVRRALHPVEEMTAVAESAEATDLSRRVRASRGGEELRRLAGVINSLFDRLERAFASQRRLIEDAAHELKTPTAIVLAEAQEALRGDTTEAQRRELLESIARAARTLARETDNLLTLARGDTPLQRRDRVDLEQVVAEATAPLLHLATERGVTVTTRANGDIAVAGEESALRRLAANLIANAIHYSHTGGDVEITIEPNELAVADRGPGIAPDDRARIFERFVRLPHARRTNPEGSGLGLAIVAQIARNHGAAVEVSERVGGGSVFVVRFASD